VVTRDGDRFVHLMVGAIDVRDHAVTQSARSSIIFFFLEIVMSLVQKLAGIMQESDPGVVRINGRAVSNVLAVVECGAFDFFDGVVDFCYGGGVCCGARGDYVSRKVPRARELS
jgi:hypothetical protein